MMEKFLALLERFVAAHELLAKNSERPVAVIGEVVSTLEEVKPDPDAEAKPTRKPRTTKPKAAPAKEPEPEEEEEPKAKAKAKAKAPDLDTLRDEIKTMAAKIGADGAEVIDEMMDDLLAKYKARTVSRVADEDVAEFHRELSIIAARDKTIALQSHVDDCDNNKCVKEFAELLEEFNVADVEKLADDDVAEFLALAKELVGKYYEIED